MVPDGSGWSAADHLRHAVRDLAMLDHAVEEVMVHDRPTLHPATLHDADREWVPDELDVEAQLDELEDVCETFADRVAAAPAEAWVRTATVGQDTVDATRLLRHAVGSALDHLTGVREALAEAR